MRRYLVTYLAVLILFILIDGIWLGLVASGLYLEGIGGLMAPTPNWVAAAAFYLLYPAGLVFFAIAGTTRQTMAAIAQRAALLGFMAYMTYDLTNLATLRDWPLGLSLLDMIWGALLSAVSASLGWRIASAAFK
ncbi:DUF2177 family protein [Dongia mobilis]|uniref:DUF2177 family protein n=1 Tax=Dongia sp. TaxID=1977262 RepID=UPI0026EFA8A1